MLPVTPFEFVKEVVKELFRWDFGSNTPDRYQPVYIPNEEE